MSTSDVAPGPDATFTERLRWLIGDLDMSQRAFARAVDEKPANLSNYCHGSSPPPSFLARVARAHSALPIAPLRY